MRTKREHLVIPRGRSGYSLRIPGVFVDPPYDRDHPDFVSPARARLVGFEMRQEREMARSDALSAGVADDPGCGGYGARDPAPAPGPLATAVARPATRVAGASTMVAQPGLTAEQPGSPLVCNRGGRPPAEADLEAVAEFGRLLAGAGGPVLPPCRLCGARPTKCYLNGWFCAEHGPTSPPHVPDPYWGAKAMRERYEQSVHRSPRPDSGG